MKSNEGASLSGLAFFFGIRSAEGRGECVDLAEGRGVGRSGTAFAEGRMLNPFLTTMSVHIQPLADRVLVEPAAAEEKTAAGLYIPDTAKEKPQRGTVIAVGPGKKDEPTTVKVGDTVLYGKYSGTELQLGGKDFMIMRESDILAVL